MCVRERERENVRVCTCEYKYHSSQESSRELNSATKHIENLKGFRKSRPGDKEPATPWSFRKVERDCPKLRKNVEQTISSTLRGVHSPPQEAIRKPATKGVKDNNTLSGSASGPGKAGKQE